MKIVKVLLAMGMLVSVAACSHNQKKENICEREGYASETTKITSSDGEIISLVIVNTIDVAKEEKESTKVLREVFDTQFDYKGVEVSDKYDEEKEVYTISIQADFAKMKKKDIEAILGNDEKLSAKDPKALMKVLEDNGFTCK